EGNVETCQVGDDGCTEWALSSTCQPPEVCDDSGNTATCVVQCNHTCELGQSRCNPAGDVEMCEADNDGCRDYVAGTDCGDNQTCTEGAGMAMCLCDDACLGDGVQSCTDMGAIQSCVSDADGCLVLTDTGVDCSAQGRACVEGGVMATCGALLAGDSCSDSIVVEGSLTLTGDDFQADFTNALNLSDPTCSTSPPGAPEVMFQVALEAGQAVQVQETGGLDAAIAFIEGCGAASACIIDTTLGDDDAIPAYGVANVPLTLTVIVSAEAVDLTNLPRDYAIQIDVLGPEVCNNGIDDEQDGVADCRDPDCAGAANCLDVPARGDHELFSSGAIDLSGVSLTFVPDDNEPNGFAIAVTENVMAFPDAPGSGSVQSEDITSTVAADDGVAYDFGQPVVLFYDQVYSVVGFSTNGHITFGSASLEAGDGTAVQLFARPRLAPLFTDLDPTAGGSMHFDVFPDRLVFSWTDVPLTGSTQGNSVQATLWTDGVVVFTYLDLASDLPAMAIGLSDGDPLGNNLLPNPVDLYLAPPQGPLEIGLPGETVEATGAITDTDIVWNRPDANCDPSGSLARDGALLDIIPIVNTTGSPQRVQITAAWGGDGYLHVYRSPFDPVTPEVGCITGDDDFQTNGSQIEEISIGVGETLVIAASTYLAGAAIGPYTITVETLLSEGEPDATPVQASTIELGDQLARVLDTDTDVDWFTFTLSTATTVNIETSTRGSGTDADTRLWLCDDTSPETCTYSAGNLGSNDDISINVNT
ncbi:MAG: PPC domain-containing protein, partial [Myxococcota bacterium]